MAKRWSIETLDRSMKDIMNSTEPFGGKVIIFGGDFRQVLPVVPRGTIQQNIDASLVKSYLWPYMERLSLSRNMRARTDTRFSEFLLRVGCGEEPINDEGNIELPNKMVIKYDDDDDDASENRLIDTIFPSLQENASSTKYMTSRAILATTNEYVDKLNENIISYFPGEAKTFVSFDEALDDTHNYYQDEFLNSLTPNGLPPHKLILKENYPIMLLRNLDPAEGLCNGTRMICKGFTNKVIHAEITTGQHSEKHVFIPRIPLSPAENEGYHFQLIREQFPVRLCFAMTINKHKDKQYHVSAFIYPNQYFHMDNYMWLFLEELQCLQQRF
ncbi:hypothetical protein ACH5RR_005159 [Cinchona calisaya]|uniref:ATP-dependent DNA helicase n=1 Tax=Cinchona calisaya TaxID=153742 RepID=A0ABD3AKG3_9GENT